MSSRIVLLLNLLPFLAFSYKSTKTDPSPPSAPPSWVVTINTGAPKDDFTGLPYPASQSYFHLHSDSTSMVFMVGGVRYLFRITNRAVHFTRSQGIQQVVGRFDLLPKALLKYVVYFDPETYDPIS